MALTVRRFKRLEVWTTWAAQGGTRVAMLPDLISLSASATAGGDERLTLSLALDAFGASEVTVGRILRVVQDASIFDEWKIADRNVAREGHTLTVTAAPPRTTMLVDAGLVARTDADGVVIHDFESVSLTPAQHIDTWILPALSAAGMSWIARGTVNPTARLDMTYSWDSPLAALLRLASATASELDLRRNGTTGYLIDLVPKVNTGTVADIRVGKNLQNVLHEQSGIEQATRIYPRGAAQEEHHATMARARWRVASITGATSNILALVDPAGGAGPILVSGQLGGVLSNKIQRTTAGLIFQDDFNRADGAPGSNWTTIDSAGTWAINGNVLRLTATGDTGLIVSDAAFGVARGEVVVETRLRRVGSNRDTFPGLYARWTLGSGATWYGTPGDNRFGWNLNNTAGNTKDVFFKSVNGTGTTLQETGDYNANNLWQSFKLAVRNSQQRGWKDGTLQINLVDASLDAINGKAGLAGGWYRATSDYHEYDDFKVYRRNTVIVTGLPTGHKARVGTRVATEAAGTATVDLLEDSCPRTKVEVLNASDVVLAEFAPSGGVWGGDDYSYTP